MIIAARLGKKGNGAMKDEKLTELKAKRDRINALIQQRNARSRVQAMKDLTRRKLVVGTIFLERLLSDEPMRKWFETQLRDSEERRLFGLESSTDDATPSGAEGLSDSTTDHPNDPVGL